MAQKSTTVLMDSGGNGGGKLSGVGDAASMIASAMSVYKTVGGQQSIGGGILNTESPIVKEGVKIDD